MLGKIDFRPALEVVFVIIAIHAVLAIGFLVAMVAHRGW